MKTVTSNKKNMQLGQQRWLLPLVIVLVVAGIAAVLLFIRKQTQKVIEKPCYQYFLDEKYEFGAGTKLLPGHKTPIIESDGNQYDGDATPVYYQDEKKLVLTNDAAWTDPSNGYEWRIPAYSEISMDENGMIWCDTGGKIVRLNGGFLNDCAGTYLFLDSVKLTIDGVQTDLPPFSFCSSVFNMIRVYSYGDERVSTVGSRTDNILMRSKLGYLLDLTTGIYTDENLNQRLLIASPELLKSIEERA